MKKYFLDSSVIVKRYFQEPGCNWAEALHQSCLKGELFISQAALIEVVASICRKAYEQQLSNDKRDKIIDNFLRGVKRTYSVQFVDEAIYLAAGQLCRSHRLRAYDAVQLASAIAIRHGMESISLPKSIQSQLIFVSADLKLLNIAQAEEFAVENPNDYP